MNTFCPFVLFHPLNRTDGSNIRALKTNFLSIFVLVSLILVAQASRSLGDEDPIELIQPGYVKAVVYSPDGKILAVGGWQDFGGKDVGGKDAVKLVGTVRILDAANNEEIRTLRHGGSEVTCLAFAPDGKTIASGSQTNLEDLRAGGTVKLWDVATGEQTVSFETGAMIISALGFTPDGKVVGAAASESISLWDTASRKHLVSFRGNESYVGDFAFSPDGKTIAAAGGKRGEASVVKLWDTNTAKEIRSLSGSLEEQVTAVAYSHDGKLLASTRGDLFGGVFLWNTTTWESRPADGALYTISSLAFSPDGKLLVVGDTHGAAALVDVASGEQIIVLTPGVRGVASVAFSPDGKSVAVAGTSSVMLWNVEQALKRASTAKK